MSTKQRIIDARKNIRMKLHALRTGQISRELTLKETFKPITDSIERFATASATSNSDPISDFVKLHRAADIDKTYGVVNGRLGGYPLKLDKDTIHVGDRDFESTPGLLNLIFLKKPTGYSSNELRTYAEILRITNVHLAANGGIKNRNTYKYRSIIKHALEGIGGSGMVIDINHKEVTTAPQKYIYYDDVNEIVDRLRLLIASSNAGNTAHGNEIVSIISELRERGVIDGGSS